MIMEEKKSMLVGNLKIISWNINGIRTVQNLKQMLDEFGADIVCLQETKVTRDMIDEPTALVEGYNAYFSFSRTRSGYSGQYHTINQGDMRQYVSQVDSSVATFCREGATPLRAEEGLSGTLCADARPDNVGCFHCIGDEFSSQELKRLDSEGRTVITQHKVKKQDGSEGVITLFNVYCPRADPERPDRLEFKLRFNKLLELRAGAVKQSGSLVMIVGDINISHRPIDRCENVDPVEFEANLSRQWLNSFLLDPFFIKNGNMSSVEKKFKMVDSFRFFHPRVENAFTCWNTKMNARTTNYGSRIDYIFVDMHLIENMTDSLILSEIQGSDHCPVAGLLNLKSVKSLKCPSACIKNFPEFSGVQQKLSTFFSKKSEITQNTAPASNLETLKRKHSGSDDTCSEFKNVSNSKKLRGKGNSAQKQISSFFFREPPVSDEKLDASCSQSSSQGSSSSVSEDTSVENIYKEELSANAVVQKIEKSFSSASAWRSMLTGPRPPPLCKGHKEPCVERTVKKKGPNFNRKFFACARGEGNKTDPRARCDHFEWALKK